MGQTEQNYDGALISELGVKRYLNATKDLKTSNVNFLIRGDTANKAWKECNFGCHGPSYRVLKKPSTYADFLKPIDDVSPLLAGVVDGVHHQTIGKVEKLGDGIKRTAEGLMLNGGENFNNVGEENLAAYEFAKTAFEKMVTFELDLLDNPITQAVMAIVSEYIALLPEWLVEEALVQNALKFPDKIDTIWLMKAAGMGLIKDISKEDLGKAAEMLNNPAQRLAGKQIGKKLAAAIGAVIATAITKKIIKESANVKIVKRKLVNYRKAARKMKGGLGGALLILLSTQGVLNRAGESSRRLKQGCPRLWNILRYQLSGANMVYFLIEGMVQEYVDRLALLESNPKEFGKVMAALIKAKQTPSIFFPS